MPFQAKCPRSTSSDNFCCIKKISGGNIPGEIFRGAQIDVNIYIYIYIYIYVYVNVLYAHLARLSANSTKPKKIKEKAAGVKGRQEQADINAEESPETHWKNQRTKRKQKKTKRK